MNWSVEPNKRDDGSSSMDLLPRLIWPTPWIKTDSIKKTQQVIVIGHSLLKETECPRHKLDPLAREVYRLPGTWVEG